MNLVGKINDKTEETRSSMSAIMGAGQAVKDHVRALSKTVHRVNSTTPSVGVTTGAAVVNINERR